MVMVTLYENDGTMKVFTVTSVLFMSMSGTLSTGSTISFLRLVGISRDSKSFLVHALLLVWYLSLRVVDSHENIQVERTISWAQEDVTFVSYPAAILRALP